MRIFATRYFCVPKIDASVPVDGRVFKQKPVLRTYVADSGLTEVKPDGGRYTYKHGKVLVEALAAGIKPLDFRRKVENNRLCISI